MSLPRHLATYLPPTWHPSLHPPGHVPPQRAADSLPVRGFRQGIKRGRRFPGRRRSGTVRTDRSVLTGGPSVPHAPRRQAPAHPRRRHRGVRRARLPPRSGERRGRRARASGRGRSTSTSPPRTTCTAWRSQASLERLAVDVETAAAAGRPVDATLEAIVLCILRFFWRRQHLLTLIQRYEQRRPRRAGRSAAPGAGGGRAGAGAPSAGGRERIAASGGGVSARPRARGHPRARGDRPAGGRRRAGSFNSTCTASTARPRVARRAGGAA